MKGFYTNQKGQALISLLFFLIIGITLISAASVVMLENVASASSTEQGTVAYFDAENGIEDALLLILRYPPTSTSPYAGGTTVYSEGQATVSLNTSGNTITITSIGTFANATRKIQVIDTNGTNGWQVTSWKEIN